MLYDPAAGGNGSIAAGGSHANQFSYTLPDGPRGTGNIEITVVADTNNNLFEYNAGGTAETNNWRLS